MEEESKDENDIRRQAALEKLENASEDSFLGQASYSKTDKDAAVHLQNIVIVHCSFT